MSSRGSTARAAGTAGHLSRGRSKGASRLSWASGTFGPASYEGTPFPRHDERALLSRTTATPPRGASRVQSARSQLIDRQKLAPSGGVSGHRPDDYPVIYVPGRGQRPRALTTIDRRLAGARCTAGRPRRHRLFATPSRRPPAGLRPPRRRSCTYRGSRCRRSLAVVMSPSTAATPSSFRTSSASATSSSSVAGAR